MLGVAILKRQKYLMHVYKGSWIGAWQEWDTVGELEGCFVMEQGMFVQ